MKFGKIAENPKINNAIYGFFDYLNEKNQKKFVKKFKEQPHNQNQVMHTFRELILGAYLSSCGFTVDYEREIGLKTPDWTICNKSYETIAIVEMAYHHIDNKTNKFIVDKLKAGNKAIAYFPQCNDPDNSRLYSTIQDKASIYRDLITELGIPYVVAVFIDFLVVIDIDELKKLLLSENEPLFNHYSNLSGVLHFEEDDRGSYKFTYIENPTAIRMINIPSGKLIKS